MHTNTHNLPSWAIEARDKAAAAIYSTYENRPTYAQGQMCGPLADELATAALAEALPLIGEHFAEVADKRADQWSKAISNGLRRVNVTQAEARQSETELRVIAIAIRREVGL